MSFLSNNKWFKNVSVLITGTVIGQAIPILLQPLLRRVFSPEDFGTFAVFASIYGMITVGSSLRFDLAINNPKEDQEAYGLLWLSQIVNGLVAAAVLLILVLAVFIGMQGQALQTIMIIGIPFSILFSGGFRAINYWFIRKEMFKLSSRNKVYRRLAQAVVQLITGFMKIPSGLIIAEIVGHGANISSAVLKMRSSVSNLVKPDFKELKAVAKKYREFALVSTGPALLNAFCMLFPSIIISENFGLDATGQYDLSRTLLMIPMALVGMSVSQIVLQQSNILKEKHAERNKFYRQLFMVMLAISLPIPPILYFFGESLFTIFFGGDWTVAAQISIILSISYSLKAVVSPFSMVLVAFEKLRIMALWQIAYAAFIGLIYWMDFSSFTTFIQFFVMGETIIYLIYGVIILNAMQSQR